MTRLFALPLLGLLLAACVKEPVPMPEPVQPKAEPSLVANAQAPLVRAVRSQPPAQPRALLVLLHGYGSDERDLLALADEQPADVAVVTLRGPVELGQGHFAWFAARFLPDRTEVDPAEVRAIRERLAREVAQLQQALHLPRERTRVAGFSQGGVMSLGLAVAHPELLGGFGMLSGRLLPEFAADGSPALARAGMQALITHGTSDARLPFAGAESAGAWLQGQGVAVEFVRFEGGHAIPPEARNALRRWVDATRR